jgi:hypothetical protein
MSHATAHGVDVESIAVARRVELRLWTQHILQGCVAQKLARPQCLKKFEHITRARPTAAGCMTGPRYGNGVFTAMKMHLAVLVEFLAIAERKGSGGGNRVGEKFEMGSSYDSFSAATSCATETPVIILCMDARLKRVSSRFDTPPSLASKTCRRSRMGHRNGFAFQVRTTCEAASVRGQPTVNARRDENGLRVRYGMAWFGCGRSIGPGRPLTISQTTCAPAPLIK